MIYGIKTSGHPTIHQSDWKKRMSHPPILWISFFGWLGSGVGLGWLMRDFTNSARMGAASVVIDVAMIAIIVSQCSVVIYLLSPYLSHRDKCTPKTLDKQ